MTFNIGQGHQNWYQNVELSGLYHHIKFKEMLKGFLFF